MKSRSRVLLCSCRLLRWFYCHSLRIVFRLSCGWKWHKNECVSSIWKNWKKETKIWMTWEVPCRKRWMKEELFTLLFIIFYNQTFNLHLLPFSIKVWGCSRSWLKVLAMSTRFSMSFWNTVTYCTFVVEFVTKASVDDIVLSYAIVYNSVL